SISADGATAPDGTETMDRLVESEDESAHAISQAVAVSEGATSTGTVYARADERSVLRIQLDDGSSTNSLRAIFDLAAGTAGAVATGGDGANGVASIEAVSGGLYRCRLTGTPSASATTHRMIVYLQDAPAGSTIYQGDGTSGL